MAVNMHMEGVQIEGERGRGGQRAEDPVAGTSSSLSARVANERNEMNAAGAMGMGEDEDDVRAPIPQKQETLVESGYEGYAIKRTQQNNPHKDRVRTVFDGFRNFGAENSKLTPCFQTFGKADLTFFSSDVPSGSGGASVNKGKKRTLEELFKPPIDLMFKGDWQSARDGAESAKKWLIVNIQDSREFACQLLNRDVWSSEAVKTILREHFIFWQQYKESDDAQRYMTFYPVNSWPHISVVDPRTGEQIVTWDRVNDSATFCDLVAQFLSQNPSLDKDDASTAPPTKKSKGNSDDDCILDAGEDAQMAAAIRASLAESQPSSSDDSKAANRRRITVDSDSSDLEFSGDDSSQQNTPVKNNSRSNRSSRAVSPEPRKSKVNGKDNSVVPIPSKEKEKTASAKNEKDWTEYLGCEKDDKSSILIRFPDGTRESKSLPCSSQFMVSHKKTLCSAVPLILN
jgi:hypothetical protein